MKDKLLHGLDRDTLACRFGIDTLVRRQCHHRPRAIGRHMMAPVMLPRWTQEQHLYGFDFQAPQAGMCPEKRLGARAGATPRGAQRVGVEVLRWLPHCPNGGRLGAPHASLGTRRSSPSPLKQEDVVYINRVLGFRNRDKVISRGATLLQIRSHGTSTAMKMNLCA